MKALVDSCDREDARLRIATLLEARGEWFCAETRGGQSVALARGDWELAPAHGALRFSYRTQGGALRVWRIAAWEWTGVRLSLDAWRGMGKDREVLELTTAARSSVRESLEAVAAARRAACVRLAALACGLRASARVERATLSAGARRSEPGRYARINLRIGRERIDVTGAVVTLGAHETDAFLASALTWWTRAGARGERDASRRLWLVVAPALKEATAERLALLREGVRRDIELFETDEGRSNLNAVALPSLGQTLERATPMRCPRRTELSETARCLVALAPDAVDVVRARHGETLRFHGLAFARVRGWMGRERVWFWTPRTPPTLLEDGNWPQLAKLVDDLGEHRRAAPNDRRHLFYTSAPEAWLESLLRRDITRLDPGLRLAPLYAQFRTAARDGKAAAMAGARPVDLLALRRDGRLVVIELKVAEDAALALQCADYWRRVEAHRRRGDIARTRLFGEARIADEPPLAYTVAPLLRFHRHFDALARSVTPEIEMYRFDLNEDWRAGVRVVRRARVG